MAGRNSNIAEMRGKPIADPQSGTPGTSAIRLKGVITRVAAADALQAEVR